MANPRRTCVGCRREAAPVELERFVLRAGQVVHDPEKRLEGRGAWLHPAPECLTAALRRGGFARSFRRSADASSLDGLGFTKDRRGR